MQAQAQCFRGARSRRAASFASGGLLSADGKLGKIGRKESKSGDVMTKEGADVSTQRRRPAMKVAEVTAATTTTAVMKGWAANKGGDGVAESQRPVTSWGGVV